LTFIYMYFFVSCCLEIYPDDYKVPFLERIVTFSPTNSVRFRGESGDGRRRVRPMRWWSFVLPLVADMYLYNMYRSRVTTINYRSPFLGSRGSAKNQFVVVGGGQERTPRSGLDLRS
jgi:hypothetical protein